MANNFPAHSAGGVMIKNVPTVAPSARVADLEKILHQAKSAFETINYFYVINGQKHLVGVLTVKEIFRQAKEVKVSELMQKDVVTVRAHTDQERVAHLALKHNLKAIPVIDKDDRFLGVVPSDVILGILNQEAEEDILRFGGVAHSGKYDNVMSLPLSKSLLRRLPWLVLGMLGGMVAAGVVAGFEKTLSQSLILAAFIPLVVYMADAVGTQMEAFVIRDLALEPKLNFSSYFWLQLVVVGCLGVIIAGLVYAISFLIYSRPTLSLVLAVALFCAILSSIITGLLIPFLFGKLKFDPANASGPIATIVQDILSVWVYFIAASLLL